MERVREMRAEEEQPSAVYVPVGRSHDDDWIARRRTGIGSSEVAIMLGQHPRYGEGGPAVLWAWKTGRQEPDDLDDVEFVQWGHRMEPVIIEAFGEYSGREVRKGGEQLRSVAHPWALTTVDGWAKHPEHGWVPLEAKNVGLYQADRWKDHAPIEMWWQCQHHCFVTGSPVTSLAACVGGNSLMWEDVPRDEDAQRRIESKGAEFWRCVNEGRVPLHVPTLLSVRAIHPPGTESGAVALAGDDWVQLDSDLTNIKEEIAALKKRKDEIEALLTNAIGSHEMATLDDGTSYTYRTQRRNETVIKASEFRVLRRKAARE